MLFIDKKHKKKTKHKTTKTQAELVTNDRYNEHKPFKNMKHIF